MKPAIKALQTKFDAAAAKAQGILDSETSTPEQLTEATELLAEAKATKAQIEELTAADGDLMELKNWSQGAARRLPNPAMKISQGDEPAGQTEVDLLTGKIVNETGSGILTEPQIKAMMNPDYVEAVKSYLRSPRGLDGMTSKDQIKALTEGFDTSAGVIAPPELVGGIIQRDPYPSRIVDLVRTITVSSDRAMMLRSLYNTDDFYSSAVRVYPTSEGALATKSALPTFGTFNLDVHDWTAELSIQVKLLEDTAFDLMGYCAEQFRTAYRNLVAAKVIAGIGVAEHFGILTRAGQSNGPAIVNSGDANLITWPGLRKIKNAVPEQYDMNCRYLFNKKSTRDAIEALVDDNNRPLWPEAQRAGLVSGVPGALQGYSYALEGQMPDVAANALPLIFGDFQGYMRAMRLGMTMQVLREVEARRGQVVILTRFRDGGDVAEPWRLKVQQIAA